MLYFYLLKEDFKKFGKKLEFFCNWLYGEFMFRGLWWRNYHCQTCLGKDGEFFDEELKVDCVTMPNVSG